MQSKAVTDIVEAHAVAHLGIEQCNNVAPVSVSSCTAFAVMLPCQFSYQMRRNEIAKLMQNG